MRHELVARPPSRTCCRTAVLSAIVRSAGVFQVRAGGELAVLLEHVDAATARLVFGLLRDAGADSEIVSYRERRFARRSVVALRLYGERSLQLLHELGVLSAELLPLERPPRRVVGRACCRAAYLRGVLAAAGSVSGPRAAGHLELRSGTREGAEGLAAVAAEDGLQLRVAERRGHAIAYAKGKQTIRDLLVYVGAHDAALSFEEAEVMAATRERANRLTNCDEANLARQGSAARRQRHAIERLELDRLAPELRELAELRLRHPDLSLAELGRQARPALPKSTVANRMRRLLGNTS
ncbi:MAG: DNA-binding protein WhiA [Gaiellales bacterium]